MGLLRGFEAFGDARIWNLERVGVEGARERLACGRPGALGRPGELVLNASHIQLGNEPDSAVEPERAKRAIDVIEQRVDGACGPVEHDLHACDQRVSGANGDIPDDARQRASDGRHGAERALEDIDGSVPPLISLRAAPMAANLALRPHPHTLI